MLALSLESVFIRVHLWFEKRCLSEARGVEASPQGSVDSGAYVGLIAQRPNPTGSLFTRRPGTAALPGAPCGTFYTAGETPRAPKATPPRP